MKTGKALENGPVKSIEEPTLQILGSSCLSLAASCERRIDGLRESILGEGECSDTEKGPQPVSIIAQLMELNSHLERLDSKLARLEHSVDGRS